MQIFRLWPSIVTSLHNDRIYWAVKLHRKFYAPSEQTKTGFQLLPWNSCAGALEIGSSSNLICMIYLLFDFSPTMANNIINIYSIRCNPVGYTCTRAQAILVRFRKICALWVQFCVRAFCITAQPATMWMLHNFQTTLANVDAHSTV